MKKIAIIVSSDLNILKKTINYYKDNYEFTFIIKNSLNNTINWINSEFPNAEILTYNSNLIDYSTYKTFETLLKNKGIKKINVQINSDKPAFYENLIYILKKTNLKKDVSLFFKDSFTIKKINFFDIFIYEKYGFLYEKFSYFIPCFFNPIIIFHFLRFIFTKETVYYQNILLLRRLNVEFFYTTLGSLFKKHGTFSYFPHISMGFSWKHVFFSRNNSYFSFYLFGIKNNLLFSYFLSFVSVLILIKNASLLSVLSIVFLFITCPGFLAASFHFAKPENLAFSIVHLSLALFSMNPNIGIILYSLIPFFSFTALFFSLPFIILIIFLNFSTFNLLYLSIAFIILIGKLLSDYFICKNDNVAKRLLNDEFLKLKYSNFFMNARKYLNIHFFSLLILYLSLSYNYNSKVSLIFILINFSFYFTNNYLFKLHDHITFFRLFMLNYFVFLYFFPNVPVFYHLFFWIIPPFYFDSPKNYLFALKNGDRWPLLKFRKLNRRKVIKIIKKIKHNIPPYSKIIVENSVNNILPPDYFLKFFNLIFIKCKIAHINNRLSQKINTDFFNHLKIFKNFKKDDIIDFCTHTGVNYFISHTEETKEYFQSLGFPCILEFKKSELSQSFFNIPIVPDLVSIFKISDQKNYKVLSGEIEYFLINVNEFKLKFKTPGEIIIYFNWFPDWAVKTNNASISKHESKYDLNYIRLKANDSNEIILKFKGYYFPPIL